MLKLVIVGLVATVSMASTLHPIREEIYNSIKQNAKTWTPMELHENPLASLSVDQIKGLTNLDLTSQIPAGAKFKRGSNSNAAIPDNFDTRDKWGQGAVHPIRDQKHCGSCWAFGATEMLSDRFFIASKGKVDVVLSP